MNFKIYWFDFSTMFKLLVIFYIVKLYTRKNSFKRALKLIVHSLRIRICHLGLNGPYFNFSRSASIGFKQITQAALEQVNDSCVKRGYALSQWVDSHRYNVIQYLAKWYWEADNIHGWVIASANKAKTVDPIFKLRELLSKTHWFICRHLRKRAYHKCDS